MASQRSAVARATAASMSIDPGAAVRDDGPGVIAGEAALVRVALGVGSAVFVADGLEVPEPPQAALVIAASPTARMVSRRAGTGQTSQLFAPGPPSLSHRSRIPGSTGFLQGRRAATHWAARKELRDLGGVEVVEGERWVRDGNVVTSAGVSAGIDMALWLVGQLKTPEDARKVQLFMEYQPAPPYGE